LIQPESPNQQTTGKGRATGQYITVPTNNGKLWLISAVKMVKKAPSSWLGMASFIMFMLLIPGINYLASFLIPVAMGGIILGCRHDSPEQPLKFDHLFAGLKQDTKNLLLVSAYYALGSLIISLSTYLILLLLGIDYQEVLVQMMPPQSELINEEQSVKWATQLLASDTPLFFLLGILISLALMIPMIMAVWFAPALIVLQKLPALTALKISFKACKDNFLPFLVFGLVAFGYLILIYFIIFIFMMIIPLLGFPLLVLSFVSFFAVSLATIYTSYQDIFGQGDRQINSNFADGDSNNTMLA